MGGAYPPASPYGVLYGLARASAPRTQIFLLTHIAWREYYPMWEVEYTDEFGEWWDSLSVGEQEALAHDVEVLRQVGPGLGRPGVDTVQGSRFRNMKELRTQHGRHALRTFFAFDPRRIAILLIGGDKSGDKRFYERMIPLADRLYEEHLKELEREE